MSAALSKSVASPIQSFHSIQLFLTQVSSFGQGLIWNRSITYTSQARPHSKSGQSRSFRIGDSTIVVFELNLQDCSWEIHMSMVRHSIGKSCLNLKLLFYHKTRQNLHRYRGFGALLCLLEIRFPSFIQWIIGLFLRDFQQFLISRLTFFRFKITMIWHLFHRIQSLSFLKKTVVFQSIFEG